jgi:enoyl-CoA hydratase/carnithine racemase
MVCRSGRECHGCSCASAVSALGSALVIRRCKRSIEGASVAQLTVDVHEAIATITIANPPLAVMDRQTLAELDALIPRLARDDVRAVVFTGGVDGYFIRHYSVTDLDDAAQGRSDAVAVIDIHALFGAVENLPKPVIAALNGTALGGGWEFAMATDIRVAKDGPFRFGLPEVTVGILPGAGGTQRLTNLVGRHRAMELMLRGRLVTPREALAYGMLEEIVDAASDETAVARAQSIAAQIAAHPSLAVAHIKRLVRSAVSPLSDDQLALEGRLFGELMRTPDAARLLAAVAAQHRASASER